MQIACPNCQKKLRIPDTAAGKMVRCPSCAETFRAAAAEQVQTLPLPLPPKLAQRPPITDEDEEPTPAVRHRRYEDDEDDFSRPARPRREFDDDDDRDDDYDDRDFRRAKAAGQGNAAANFFIVAGIITLVLITLNIGSTLYVTARMGGAAGGPNLRGQQVAENVGQVIGLFGCGIVGVIGCIYHFMASASLKSFQGKGQVITAIVFGFIFGLVFAIGVVINLALISQVPGGGLKTLVMVTIFLGATTSALNVVASILGLGALNKPAVARAFRARRY